MEDNKETVILEITNLPNIQEEIEKCLGKGLKINPEEKVFIGINNKLGPFAVFVASNKKPDNVILNIYINPKTEEADLTKAINELIHIMPDIYPDSKTISIIASNKNKKILNALLASEFPAKENLTRFEKILHKTPPPETPKRNNLQKIADAAQKQINTAKIPMPPAKVISATEPPRDPKIETSGMQIKPEMKITRINIDPSINNLAAEEKTQPPKKIEITTQQTNAQWSFAKPLKPELHIPKNERYPMHININNPDPKKANNDLTEKENRFFAENKTAIENLIKEIFKSIKFNGLHNPLKINLNELLKIYDIKAEIKKIRLIAIMGKKLNRYCDEKNNSLGRNQIEKIILSENDMEIFFEQALRKPIESAIPMEQDKQRKTQTKTPNESIAPTPTTDPLQDQFDDQIIRIDLIKKVGKENNLTPNQEAILKNLASFGSLKTNDIQRIKGINKGDITELENKKLIILEKNKYKLNF